MDATTRTIGLGVEKKAREYLENQGLVFRESNYQRPLGEIDLIMEDQNTLVFIEVRFRENDRFGGALASVSGNKQRKIIRTAKLYLLEKKLYDKVYCRFDIITGETIDGLLAIEWFKNAFTENFI